MSWLNYEKLCADPQRFSFDRLPLLLPTPRYGRSWTIEWGQPDGKLVQSGEWLLHISSDGGAEQDNISAPVPGRLKILIPDSRFVAHSRPVGVLEYGIGFTPPPPPTSKLQSLTRQVEAVRQAKAKQARGTQAEERQQREREDRLRALSQEVAEAAAGAAAVRAYLNKRNEVGIASLPGMREAFAGHTRALLVEEQQTRLAFPVVWQCLLLMARLPETPTGGPRPPQGDRTAAGLVDRFFNWLLPQISAASPPLPPELEEHRQECWEEISEACSQALPPHLAPLPPEPRR